MTMQDLLLESVEQRVLRQLDVQFAMMIAADQPAVMLAAALLSKDAGEGHVCLPLSRLVVDEKMPPVLQSWVRGWTGRKFCANRRPSGREKTRRR